MRSAITEAKLEKRYNTGEYEHEVYTLTAVVDEKESGALVLSEMKKQIHEAYSGQASEVEEEKAAPTTKSDKKSDKKEEKKNGKSKSTKASVANDEDADDESTEEEDSGDADESDADDEAADSEDSDSDDDSSDDSEESDDDSSEDDAEEKSTSKSASKKDSGKSSSGKESGKKKFVKKPQAYDRTIEEHKNIFSKQLGFVAPSWKNSDVTKAKAKKVSETLAGTPFLDENGEVLATFKAELKKLMIVKKK